MHVNECKSHCIGSLPVSSIADLNVVFLGAHNVEGPETACPSEVAGPNYHYKYLKKSM